MDAQRLAEVEGRLKHYGAKAVLSDFCPHRVDYVADVSDLLVALRDALDLLGRVACDERHAAEVGAARERGAIADWLERRGLGWETSEALAPVSDPDDYAGVAQAECRVAAKAVRARGPCLPALPAEALAAQNERLRGALREFVRVAEGECWPSLALLAPLLDAAREALGKGGGP